MNNGRIRETSRRRLLRALASSAAGLSLGGISGVLQARQAPAVGRPAGRAPAADWGLQIGEPRADGALIWSRCDRDARMMLQWSRQADLRDAVTLDAGPANAARDHTARLRLADLPPDSEIHLRLWFEADGSRSAPLTGLMRTLPERSRDLRFVWGGDTVGQGWGIDPHGGGMRIYRTMLARRPDFFVHSGDTIYADGPLAARVALPDGGVWNNAFLDAVPEKRRVAQTLHEFHRHHLYNLYDDHLRAFNAAVPQFWQWDDHEVVNNWSPGKALRDDPRYQVKDIARLAARGRRAWLDYAPFDAGDGVGSARIYRRRRCGPDVELFLLDMRSERAANTHNRQPEPSAATALLGPAQLDWLKRALADSTATWRIVCSDMPLGLQVTDGVDEQGRARFENGANGDGPPLGREFEIAELLGFLRAQRVANVVWLTADVHYCAAHRYAPQRARFTDFDAFWEFVAGPLHAGTFGPGMLDDTFGPEVVFHKAPPPGQANLPPSAGLQFFGQVDLDAATKTLTVSLVDSGGTTLFSQVLTPCAAA